MHSLINIDFIASVYELLITSRINYPGLLAYNFLVVRFMSTYTQRQDEITFQTTRHSRENILFIRC